MYLIIIKTIESQRNPYYYPSVGKIEPEYINIEVPKTIFCKELTELSQYLSKYPDAEYYKADRIYPKLKITTEIDI